MSARFEVKVAIITGAAKGMGQATAVEMSRDGAAVVITDIDATGLDETAGQIRGNRGKVLAIACDIQDRMQVDSLVSRTKNVLGRLDIVVNNAGLLLPAQSKRRRTTSSTAR
jgi:3-oxoacyl-[acyl-carrier protein] reductase